MLHIKYAEQLNNQNIYDHIHSAINDNMICLFLH
jgi:hypothetical protein